MCPSHIEPTDSQVSSAKFESSKLKGEKWWHRAGARIAQLHNLRPLVWSFFSGLAGAFPPAASSRRGCWGAVWT